MLIDVNISAVSTSAAREDVRRFAVLTLLSHKQLTEMQRGYRYANALTTDRRRVNGPQHNSPNNSPATASNSPAFHTTAQTTAQAKA